MTGNRATHLESASGGRKKPTVEYMAWQGIIARTERETSESYPQYGGRGIRMCASWRSSYETFLADMGRRPSPRHSIERIDNDGHYCKENCRWATKAEQNRNQRSNRWVTIDGITKCLSDWAKESPVRTASVFSRLARGWSPKEAVFSPGNRNLMRKPGPRKTRKDAGIKKGPK